MQHLPSIAGLRQILNCFNNQILFFFGNLSAVIIYTKAKNNETDRFCRDVAEANADAAGSATSLSENLLQ